MIDKVLIVGHGSIGKRHLEIVRESLPRADIRVLRHKQFEGVPDGSNGCFFDLNSALDFRPQAAILANPAPLHIPIASRLSSVKCHLLIEKPLSHSLDGVDALIDQSMRQGNSLLVGYNLRYLESLVCFRDTLYEGRIGQIVSVRCEVGQYLPSWRKGKPYTDTVSAKKELGGGVLLELSHELDYLRWIFGEVEWVNAWISPRSSLLVDVEDTAHVIIGFLPKGNSTPTVATLSLDFVRHDAVRRCTAIGENGTLEWDAISGVVKVFKVPQGVWEVVFEQRPDPNETYRKQWEHFLQCIRGACPPKVSGSDGKAVLSVIEAVRTSAEGYGMRAFVTRDTA
jgi:predicted dehydrogenase